MFSGVHFDLVVASLRKVVIQISFHSGSSGWANFSKNGLHFWFTGLLGHIFEANFLTIVPPPPLWANFSEKG